MDELYETQISNVRWIVYDIPGNVGWIKYIVAMILSFVEQPGFMENSLIKVCMAVGILPAVAMLVGIAELLSERYHKLDRVLTKKRLYRGFGSLTWGGFGGIIVSLNVLMASVRMGIPWIESRNIMLMLTGSILCFLFAGLLLRGYKKLKMENGNEIRA